MVSSGQRVAQGHKIRIADYHVSIRELKLLRLTAPTTTLTSFGEAKLKHVLARHKEFVHRLTQLKRESVRRCVVGAVVMSLWVRVNRDEEHREQERRVAVVSYTGASW
jgi:hypothetical protein